MSRDDKGDDYFMFLPRLTIIGFLASYGLFTQNRDRFRLSSGIVIPVPPRLYFKNMFYLFYFIL